MTGLSSTVANVVRNASCRATTRHDARRKASEVQFRANDCGPGKMVGGADGCELMRVPKQLLSMRKRLTVLILHRRRGCLGQLGRRASKLHARPFGQLADTGPIHQHRQRKRRREPSINLELQLHQIQ